jgi:two-component system nitrate/nitrite response regulator NarL
MTGSPLRLVLVDHDATSRIALRRTLATAPTLVLVAHGATAAAALSLVEQHQPDVFLLDLALEDGGSFDVLARVAQTVPAMATLALAPHTHDATMLTALTLGARGVIAKQAPPALLFESIRTVADGRYWVTAEQLPTIIESLRTSTPAKDAIVHRAATWTDGRPFGLTRRELDIVAAIAEGQSNKEIAERFSVKECTVKHHVSSVFDKVGVFSRLELAMFALHHHLVSFTDLLH